MTTRKIGVGLIVMGCVLLLYIAVSAPPYARAHPHLDPAMVAQYAAPWPVALCGVVALACAMLALVPIRRGERWAWWTLLAMLLTLFATRIATDPRCLVVLDPHQHGCHTFMIAVALGVVGLLMAWRR
jgi:hypothetical protein